MIHRDLQTTRWRPVALAACLFALAGCNDLAPNPPPAAAAPPAEASAKPAKEAAVDPAALYDPPTIDVAPPEVTGKRQSAPDFPDVLLTDHNGNKVRFYEELVKGKIVFINFMYATCTGT